MQYNKLPYLQPLRDSDVYPPFGEIERIVMASDERKPLIAMLAWPAIEGTVVLIVAVALLWSVSTQPERFVANGTVPTARVNASVANISEASPRVALAAGAGTAQRHATVSSNRSSAREASSQPRSSGSISSSVGQKNSAPDDIAKTDAASAMPAASKEIGSQTADSQGIGSQKIGSTDLLAMSSSGTIKNWEAYLSGAFIVPPSGIPTGALAQPFAASVGVRYRWNESSSVILELRKNTFVTDQASASTAFTGASFSFDGHNYQNEIGSASTPVTYSGESVLSLDAGYRYELWPESALTPFAQALAGAGIRGGSLSGMLTSESVGLRYALTSSLMVDAGARADQLLAPRSSPERVLAFEAGIGFAW